MNRRSEGDDFGYLLPLEPGTNVIVLVAADGSGSNLSSRVLLVERSETFQAEITSPAFGSFAEGQSNVVSGYVSAQMNDGTTNAPTLVAVRMSECNP